MKQYILCKFFLDVYNELNPKKKLKIRNYEKLENALKEYLTSILGYKIKKNYSLHSKEIKIYLENIFNFNKFNKFNLVNSVILYQEEYQKILSSIPLIEQFLIAMNLLYEEQYSNRDLLDRCKNNFLEDINFSIRHKENSFNLIATKSELPSIYINDIYSFEKILNEYINTIKNSDSNYNVFSKKYYDILPDNNKIRMIFQCTMCNATQENLLDIENYFNQYINFLNDKTFINFKTPKYLSSKFDDQIYIMLKNSDLEYETPYYLSLILNNNKVELPNIRLGIEEKEDKKIAHIYSSLIPQIVLNNNNLNNIIETAKEKIPQSFNSFNPLWIISIITTIGLLRGIGIKYIIFKENGIYYYKKTPNILENNHNGNSINISIIKVKYLLSIINGIDVISNTETYLKIKINDKISCENEFLQFILESSIILGENNKN